MSKVASYRELLSTLDVWDTYLLQECGLPGPRGNLELAEAVAEEGTEQLFVGYLAHTPDKAPTNSPEEFFHFCGVLGLGRLVAAGKREYLTVLRERASDPRWRSREAVAMALQHWGKKDMDALLEEMESWSHGSAFEQRAAAAALCEPALLRDPRVVDQVLRILDSITSSMQGATNRQAEDFQALRKSMGYCWSVAVVAHPGVGKPMMECWFGSEDADIRWVMRENLGKKRIQRMDAPWVAQWSVKLRSNAR